MPIRQDIVDELVAAAAERKAVAPPLAMEKLKERARRASERSSYREPVSKKWYSGGTLHNKSALEWQTASSEDKLATCGDFVTKMWQNGDLKPSIANNLSTVDDVRPYAKELVDFLDGAFAPDPDPELNRILFTNQTVASFAAIGMITMGWARRGG